MKLCIYINIYSLYIFINIYIYIVLYIFIYISCEKRENMTVRTLPPALIIHGCMDRVWTTMETLRSQVRSQSTVHYTTLPAPCWPLAHIRVCVCERKAGVSATKRQTLQLWQCLLGNVRPVGRRLLGIIHYLVAGRRRGRAAE